MLSFALLLSLNTSKAHEHKCLLISFWNNTNVSLYNRLLQFELYNMVLRCLWYENDSSRPCFVYFHLATSYTWQFMLCPL